MNIWPRCLQQTSKLPPHGKLVTFARPFFLKGLDGMQPAGTYRVEAGAGREGRFASFMGEYRGLGSRRTVRVIRANAIDPLDLAMVLIRDAIAAEAATT